MNLSWVPYLATMLASAEVRAILRNLFRLTDGSVPASKAALQRMRDQGFVLVEAEADIDRKLHAIDEADAKRKGPAA